MSFKIIYDHKLINNNNYNNQKFNNNQDLPRKKD